MIRIIQRQRDVGTTKICQACVFVSIQKDCNNCSGRIVTAYSCDYCGAVAHFNGAMSPVVCSCCKKSHPEIGQLYSKKRVRAHYHV